MKKVVFSVLVLLFVCGTVLYAQENADLRPGAYRMIPATQGGAMVLIQNTSFRTLKNIMGTSKN